MLSSDTKSKSKRGDLFSGEMNSCAKKGDACPQLLDLIPTKREWLVKRDDKRSSEEKKLELRLGPPGDDDCWGGSKEASKNCRDRDESLLSLGYLSNEENQPHNFSPSTETSQVGAAWFNEQQQAKAPFLQFSPGKTATATPQGLPAGTAKESSQTCCAKVAVDMQQGVEKKAFSPSTPANTAVPNSSQKRTAPGPVVGWPPIRSFRKNLASSSSSKQALESQNGNPNKKVASETPVETCKKGLFVKINMDGVPIGRKVDLKACDSYEKLSTAVDELFRGLLAAQRDSSVGGIMNKQAEERPITGVLGGSGEYTLVYEDNEGDRMLVGDVPWHMFISTVKRLRVLKSSDVSALNLGSSGKTRCH